MIVNGFLYLVIENLYALHTLGINAVRLLIILGGHSTNANFIKGWYCKQWDDSERHGFIPTAERKCNLSKSREEKLSLHNSTLLAHTLSQHIAFFYCLKKNSLAIATKSILRLG